jgi:uncharacterized protein (DUF302 family)
MNELRIAKSDFSVKETVDRIAAQIQKEGWHLFARIDHAKEARQKGLELRPTELILFGNPEIGTKLMQDRQVSAIDLPMKVLVWKNEKEQVNVMYNSMGWLKKRHGLSDDETIENIAHVIERVCSAAKK